MWGDATQIVLQEEPSEGKRRRSGEGVAVLGRQRPADRPAGDDEEERKERKHSASHSPPSPITMEGANSSCLLRQLTKFFWPRRVPAAAC